MIKSTRAENVYNFVNAITSITSLCSIYSQKPDEWSIGSWTYCFIQIVSDIPQNNSNVWYINKQARVSFTIVCKDSLWSSDTPERVLGTVIDTITNNIVNQWSNKKTHIDWLILCGIREDTVSPIFMDQNRHYIVKDYIFTYISLSDG